MLSTAASGRPSPPPLDRLNAATFFLDRHLADGRGEAVAFRLGDRAITYAAVVDAVGRAAAAFRARRVAVGDRVLLALTDSPAFVASFWGAVRIGAVAVPVNPLMSVEEHAFLLSDSQARVAVVEPEVAARLLARPGACSGLEAVLVPGAVVPAGAESLDLLLAEGSPDPAPAPTGAGDAAYWGYTSGSTGAPKAAVHTHRGFVAAADCVGVGVFGLRPDDVVFSASKMYFAFGLGNTLYFPARVGASALLVPGRLEPREVLETIAARRPTAFFAVATLYARMLAVAEAGTRHDLSSLRMCVSSGEALPPAVFDAWKARFGHELVDVVGSTEALHDFIANRPGQVRRGSVGRLVPGFEARLVDDDDRPVATGAVGHLLIKGPTTARAYWNRPERTRATMRGEWLRTGDMVWQDAEGFFHLAGRADDMLKVSGQWVSPAEVEAALTEHPAVAEAGVVGRADGDGLVRPHAVAVLGPGHAPTAALADEIRAFLRGRLAGYKVPSAIEFAAALPRTATGKIQRFRLRA